MIYLYYLLFITMITYFSFLLWLIVGNSFNSKQKIVSEFPPVSVLVAVRDGAGSLPNLISDLSQQEYSGIILGRQYNRMLTLSIASQNKANEELSKIFYSGSKKIGKF